MQGFGEPGLAKKVRGTRHKDQRVRCHQKTMIEPALFEALLEELDDQELHRKVLSSMSERSKAIEVDIDDI